MKWSSSKTIPKSRVMQSLARQLNGHLLSQTQRSQGKMISVNTKIDESSCVPSLFRMLSSIFGHGASDVEVTYTPVRAISNGGCCIIYNTIGVNTVDETVKLAIMQGLTIVTLKSSTPSCQ